MIVGAAFTVFSSDLDASRAFYADRLGFAIDDVSPESFVARRDDLQITVEGGAHPRKRGRRWLAEAGIYVTIRTDDFDSLYADLAGRGVKFLDEVTETPDGRRITGFADPDGALFEVTEA